MPGAAGCLQHDAEELCWGLNAPEGLVLPLALRKSCPTTHRLGVLAAVSGPGFKQRVWISAGVLARGLAAANTLWGLGFISRSPVLSCGRAQSSQRGSLP